MSSGLALCYSECGHLRVVGNARGLLCCAVAGGALGEHTGYEAVRGSAALKHFKG